MLAVCLLYTYIAYPTPLDEIDPEVMGWGPDSDVTDFKGQLTFHVNFDIFLFSNLKHNLHDIFT